MSTNDCLDCFKHHPQTLPPCCRLQSGFFPLLHYRRFFFHLCVLSQSVLCPSVNSALCLKLSRCVWTKLVPVMKGLPETDGIRGYTYLSAKPHSCFCACRCLSVCLCPYDKSWSSVAPGWALTCEWHRAAGRSVSVCSSTSTGTSISSISLHLCLPCQMRLLVPFK